MEMKPLFRLSGVCLALMALSGTAAAQTEIQWWHSMTGALGDRLNGLAERFNKSQPDYKVNVPVFKGSYPESMAAVDRRLSVPAARRTSCRSSRSAPRR
jgi:sn-glycerol 3-phosphate transport system substrate-binding protein